MSPKASPPAQSGKDEEFVFHLSKQELLGLQIQALLDASDDVDITADVAEELLGCLPDASEEDADGAPGEGGEKPNSSRPPDSQDEVDGDDTIELIAKNGNVDIWDIFDPYNRAEEAWTRQEVRQILHYLKERGASAFITEYVINRAIPITKLLQAFGLDLCPEVLAKSRQTVMYALQVGMSFHLRKREKLPQHNSIADAIQLIRNSQRILILTGAGISVSCGIPDFRSKNGLYATLKDRGEYDMDDPQQMFDIEYFREKPSVFYSFAREIYPSKFVPSPCHRFIKAVEEHGKLLRNYTQNIDTLETLVGVERVLQCHGSFATASCLQCKRQVPGKEIEREILSQKIPLCTVCNVPESQPPPPPPKPKKKLKKGQKEWEQSDSEDEKPPAPNYPPYLMKPDITFFGEKLNDVFDRSLADDRDKVDLLLVIGTSLKVAPVADILSHLPHSIPQILINKTPVPHINPDIVLLGNSDDIVLYLVDELGWDLPPAVARSGGDAPVPSKRTRGSLKRRNSSDPRLLRPPVRVGSSHVWLFEGAEGGKWLEDVRQRFPIPPPRSQASSRRPSPTDSHSSNERSAKKPRTG
ncbi:histone deacetylase [Coprinopsis sp. MPI-PUGE-AT-0042]|nr:histone deacetylase [Coprinopsis sp. MPI-PUGE-AT-0042]